MTRLNSANLPRRRRHRPLPLVGLAVAALLTAGACGGDDDDESAAPGIEGLRTFEVESAKHVEGDVDYPQTPPVGGDHAGAWINCGAYTSPVPEEMAVHSMEHGAVWVTYQPDLVAAQVAKLAEIAEAQTYVLVSPYPGLPSPVVASAWGVQLQLPSAHDDRLIAFLDTYRAGDQTPEPDAPCTSGITPQ